MEVETDLKSMLIKTKSEVLQMVDDVFEELKAHFTVEIISGFNNTIDLFDQEYGKESADRKHLKKKLKNNKKSFKLEGP